MKAPFELIEERLTPLYNEILQETPQVTLASQCECCQRKPSNFKGEAYEVTDSSQSIHTLCRACAMIFLKNGELLGRESNGVDYRFSSFKGGYLILPANVDQPVELWMGGGYLKTLNNEGPVKIVSLSGHKAKKALLEERSDRLVIGLSIRRELFLRNLRMSNEKTLYVATDTGTVGVSYDDYQAIKDAMDQSCIKGDLRTKLITVLRLIKQDLISVTSKRATEVFEKTPIELLTAIRNTSQDPIGFMFILDALSA